MEQIIVIAVFAFAAAICVSILATSYLQTVNAVDTKNALIAAESAAESFKAFSGDTNRVAEFFGTAPEANGDVFISFDSDWRPGEAADFVLHMATRHGDFNIILSDISVTDMARGEELVSFTVATRGVQNE